MTTNTDFPVVLNGGGAQVPIEDESILIYLVPGAWHHPDIFTKLRKLLPYPSLVHHHETTGAVPANKNLHDDGLALRTALTAQVEAGKKVLVFLHSYAGTVSASALTDNTLSISYRQRNNLQGGIIMLLYVSSVIVPAGQSVVSSMAASKTNEVAALIDVSGTYLFVKADAVDAFYHDLEDPEEAKYWASRLQHGCLGGFTEAVDVAPWDLYPAIYVITEEDRSGPKEKQEELVEMMGKGCRKIVRIPTGHSPFLSRPALMVEVMRDAVESGLEWSKV